MSYYKSLQQECRWLRENGYLPSDFRLDVKTHILEDAIRRCAEPVVYEEPEPVYYEPRPRPKLTLLQKLIGYPIALGIYAIPIWGAYSLFNMVYSIFDNDYYDPQPVVENPCDKWIEDGHYCIWSDDGSVWVDGKLWKRADQL